MATLNEIIGGIAKDITQSQITADITSLDYLKQYKDHEILKHLQIPRVSLKNVKLKLRFAIQELTSVSYSESVVKEVDNRWTDNIKENVLPSLIANISDNPEIKSAFIVSVKKAVEKVGTPLFDSKNALEGKSENHIALSTTYIKNIINRMPQTIRDELPAITEIETQAKFLFQKSFEEKKDQLSKLATAKAASELNLKVLVTEQDLSQLSPERVHEIDISFDLDFIQMEREK